MLCHRVRRDGRKKNSRASADGPDIRALNRRCIAELVRAGFADARQWSIPKIAAWLPAIREVELDSMMMMAAAYHDPKSLAEQRAKQTNSEPTTAPRSPEEFFERLKQIER